jgi:uncharacterized protein (DUF342 family)
MQGQVWVKGGRLYAEGSPENGEPATVIPAPEIILLVNGRECAGSTALTSRDEIMLLPRVVSKPGGLVLEISRDRMQAWLEVTSEVKTSYSLIDHSPAKHIELKSNPEVSTSMPWTVQEVLNFLREKGIIYGIIEESISVFLGRGQGGRFLAAQGTPPGIPVDEHVEVLFKIAGKGLPAVRTDGSVDFKDLQIYTSVGQGTLLAIKSESIPGQDGMALTGETVPPPKPKKFPFQAGSNTEVSADGLSVRAAMSGRPIVRRDGDTYRFEIVPVLEHDADVNLKSGSIGFSGDVRVRGAVAEGMAVHADGQIEISGSVSGAVITGGRGVVVKGNVFSSKIRAGGKGAHLAKYQLLLNELTTEYELALVSCNQLVQSSLAGGRSITAGQALMALVDHRFKGIRPRVSQLRDMVSITKKAGLWLPESLERASGFLAKVFLSIEMVSLETIRPLIIALTDLRTAKSELMTLSGRRSDIVLAAVTNSLVEATGSVRVGKQGCYNSTIVADGGVHIDGPLTGGLVQSKGDVTVATVGNERAVSKTKIQIQREAIVRVDLSYPGLVIQIENRSLTLDTAMRRIKAVLNQESGDIDLQGLRVR